MAKARSWLTFSDDICYNIFKNHTSDHARWAGSPNSFAKLMRLTLSFFLKKTMVQKSFLSLYPSRKKKKGKEWTMILNWCVWLSYGNLLKINVPSLDWISSGKNPSHYFKCHYSSNTIFFWNCSLEKKSSPFNLKVKSSHESYQNYIGFFPSPETIFNPQRKMIFFSWKIYQAVPLHSHEMLRDLTQTFSDRIWSWTALLQHKNLQGRV